ncbi:MAG: 4-(cytidine 5'-diphospho)-2-C-methyl-D-erythritol kinase [Solimonas sp.]
MTQTDSTRPFTAGYPWPAPAKLNLFLHVTGRRADGYHELQTLFQFVDFGDSLYFVPRGDGEFTRSGGPHGVSAENDLVLRAARAIRQASGATLGADIRVEKRIPMGAGLGGGSSDAATTLVALNRLWNLGLPADELAQIGLHLGADVPVFVRGYAAWAEGIGERLTPVIAEEPWYVIVVPPVSVSTAEIFKSPALVRDHARVDLEDYRAGRTGNACEAVTVALHPEVGQALAWLGGHAPARMSGTGASVFAAFPSEGTAHAVAARAPAGWHAIVARGRNRSPLLDTVARS